MQHVIHFLAGYLPDVDSARTLLSVMLILVSVTAALKMFQLEGRPVLKALSMAAAISAFIAVLNVYAYPEPDVEFAAPAADDGSTEPPPH